MLIKCQECGHENQLGAIFCRSCGKKLDLEAVNPELKDTKKLGIFKAVRRITMLCLLVALIAIICGLFMAPGGVDYTPLDDAQKLEAEKKQGMMDLKIQGGAGKMNTFTFSPAEATYLLNNVILEKTDTSETNPPIIIKNDFFKRTHVIVKGKIYDYVPVRLELVGVLVSPDSPDSSAPDVEDTGKISLSVKVNEVRMGRISLPGQLKDLALANFKPILESEKVKKTLSAIKEAQIDEEGNFATVLKPFKKQDAK